MAREVWKKKNIPSDDLGRIGMSSSTQVGCLDLGGPIPILPLGTFRQSVSIQKRVQVQNGSSGVAMEQTASLDSLCVHESHPERIA